MKRNNIWNRLFHKDEVQENKKKMSTYIRQRESGQGFISAIKDCNSLLALVYIHKNAWSNGFQNVDIAPNPYGVFQNIQYSYNDSL